MSYLYQYPLLKTKVIEIYEDNKNYEVLLTPVDKNFSSSMASILRKTVYAYTISTGVIGVKINSIASEFENIPGLKEDTISILSNIKNIIISSSKQCQEKHVKFRLRSMGPGKVKASSFETGPFFQIQNPESEICTISDSSQIEIELLVSSGIGLYDPVSIADDFIKYIPLNSYLSPVTNVSYFVNHYPHYEELAFHVSTNGSVRAKEVFYHACELIQSKFLMLAK